MQCPVCTLKIGKELARVDLLKVSSVVSVCTRFLPGSRSGISLFDSCTKHSLVVAVSQ